jgi:hypothetical protein
MREDSHRQLEGSIPFACLIDRTNDRMVITNRCNLE